MTRDELLIEATYWQGVSRRDHIQYEIALTYDTDTAGWVKFRERSAALARDYLFRALDMNVG